MLHGAERSSHIYMNCEGIELYRDSSENEWSGTLFGQKSRQNIRRYLCPTSSAEVKKTNPLNDGAYRGAIQMTAADVPWYKKSA